MEHVSIDENSPVPAYYQLYEALTKVVEGMKPGNRLPTERELAEDCGLARSTVRQALNRLEADGVIGRRQGAGTYVTARRFVQDISLLTGFSNMFPKSWRISTRVASLRLVPVPPHVNFTGVDCERAVELRRVRDVDRVPMSFETVWLPGDRCAALVDATRPFTSLYAALAELGVYPHSGHERLSATCLDDFEAAHLGQRAGAPALLIDRHTFDRDGISVEQVKTLLRADRFAFSTDLALNPSERKP